MLPSLKKFHVDIVSRFVDDVQKLLVDEEEIKSISESEANFVKAEEIRKLREGLMLRSENVRLSILKLWGLEFTEEELTVGSVQMNTLP